MSNHELPEGWEEKELAESAEIIMGQSPSSKDYNTKKIGMAFFQGKTEFGKKYTAPTKWCSKQVRIAKKGDILLSVRAPVGPVNIANEDCCIGRGLCAIRAKKILNQEYLYFFMKINEKKLENKGSGSTFKAINRKEIEKIKIPVPPLPAQKQIVSILERAERLKEKRKQANELTAQLAQSVFLEMFGDPVKNIKYPVMTLKEVCVKITDGTHITPNYLEKGVPFLRVTDLTHSNESKKYISKDEYLKLTKRCKPEKGDILYTKNGTIGIAKTVDWDYEFSIFVSLCLLKPKKELMLPRYLEVFLNTPFALQQAVSHSKKGTITNLHLNEIQKIKLPVPSKEEQHEFIKCMNKIEVMQNKQSEANNQIASLFDSLMQKAFNGELVS